MVAYFATGTMHCKTTRNQRLRKGKVKYPTVHVFNTSKLAAQGGGWKARVGGEYGISFKSICFTEYSEVSILNQLFSRQNCAAIRMDHLCFSNELSLKAGLVNCNPWFEKHYWRRWLAIIACISDNWLILLARRSWFPQYPRERWTWIRNTINFSSSVFIEA